MSYTYEYPRPALTVDAIILCEKNKSILLIQRRNEPFKNLWALPGGFVDENEDIDDAVVRELEEETSVCGVDLEQFKAYGKFGRVPRAHTVSIVYFGWYDSSKKARAKDDALALKWFDINNLPEMAFDHNDILKEFLESKVIDSYFQS